MKKTFLIQICFISAMVLNASFLLYQQAPKQSFEGWYILKTKSLGKIKCMEGNQTQSPIYSGAAFMHNCYGATGQQWKLEPAEQEGYFRLKTRFRGEDECLDGNSVGESLHYGAAFMNQCNDKNSQLWQVEHKGEGYYRLKTLFHGTKLCLEGNRARTTISGPAVFMNNCKNISTQYWKLEKY